MPPSPRPDPDHSSPSQTTRHHTFFFHVGGGESGSGSPRIVKLGGATAVSSYSPTLNSLLSSTVRSKSSTHRPPPDPIGGGSGRREHACDAPRGSASLCRCGGRHATASFSRPVAS